MHLRMDRHSGTGTRGLPKKNGAGGKTVWGSAMDQAPLNHLDKNDPNYDSDEEVLVAPPDISLTPTSAIPIPSGGAKTSGAGKADAAGKGKQSATPASADSSPNTSAALPSPAASN